MNVRVFAVLTSLTSGCSFVFGGGPPAQHEQMPYFDCTSTFGLPVADGFFALSGAVAAGTTLNQSEEEYKLKNNNKGNRNAAAGINIGMAAGCHRFEPRHRPAPVDNQYRCAFFHAVDQCAQAILRIAYTGLLHLAIIASI